MATNLNKDTKERIVELFVSDTLNERFLQLMLNSSVLTVRLINDHADRVVPEVLDQVCTLSPEALALVNGGDCK